jgi:sugar-phosphatase
MMKFQASAILFDMDGTLVNSTAVVEHTWTEWARANGYDPEYVVSYSHGRPTEETLRVIAPHINAETEAAVLLAKEELDPTPILSIPGAREAVAAAARFGKWAVVTSATRRLAKARLRMTGLAAPPVLISSGDIQHGKPHPEPYLRAAEQLGVLPADCIVFEDAPTGIEAGQAAGMMVIGLATTFPASELACDVVIADFRGLRIEAIAEGRMRISVLNPISAAARERGSSQN